MVARISKFRRYVSYQKEMAPPARRQCTAVLPDRIGLPKQVTISRTALVLPSDFSVEEWQTVGAKLAAYQNGIQWWLGDWWHYGAHAYGARQARVKAKGAFPYAFPTLMNWGWVAGSVATSLRREALSWSHHELIARYPPDEQKKWLDRAEMAEWSVKKFGQSIYEAQQRDERFINEEVSRWARDWSGQAGPYRGGFAHFNIELLSPLSSSHLRSLAEQCDAAATWWTETGDTLRDLSAKNARKESGEQEEEEEEEAEVEHWLEVAEPD